MSVRRAVLGLEAAVLALLVAVGVIDDATSTAIATVAAAAVPFAVETVRAGGFRAVLRSEPVRAAAYPVAAAVLALLVQQGVIDDGLSALIAGIASLVLVGGAEAARSVVTPAAHMVRVQR